jgi:hypothetical protein
MSECSCKSCRLNRFIKRLLCKHQWGDLTNHFDYGGVLDFRFRECTKCGKWDIRWL